MNRRIKDIAKATIIQVPVIGRFATRTLRRRRFKTELALLASKHENSNTHTSIIHFSFNKAATQHVKSILRACASYNRVTPVDIHDYAFDTDLPFLNRLSAQEMKAYEHIFRKKGYLYSVFGGMIEGIPDLQSYKVILVVRDPRDILVSEYFSIRFSHPTPDIKSNKRNRFLARRSSANNMTLDEYVISESNRLKQTFDRYENHLFSKHNDVYITSYEHMTCDFEDWLRGLLKYCELEISSTLFQALARESKKQKPQAENIYQHVRSGKSGNYKDKLGEEAIADLNEKFAGILHRYGFKI